MAPQQPQQPQQPIKQFQPGVAPVVPDGQGKIYAKGTGGPVVNDQSVPAMTPVKPSATTPQPLNVPQVGVFPPDPSKMANFNNKYLRIAKEWRKKTAEKAGIMEKKAIGLGLLSSGLGALTTGNKDLYGNLKDKFEWATDKVDGWRGGFGSSHAGATSQGQGGGYGGQPNPFDAPGDLGWEHKYGPPLKPGGLQSTAKEFGQGPVTLKPPMKHPGAGYSPVITPPGGTHNPTALPMKHPGAGYSPVITPPGGTHNPTAPPVATPPPSKPPAPFKSQWYVPGGRGAYSGFGGSVPYTGSDVDSSGEPYRSGRIKVTNQAQKDKIDAHYNRRQAEYHRRKALWQKNMQGKYHRRNIPYWKYSADKYAQNGAAASKLLDQLLDALKTTGVGALGGAVGGSALTGGAIGGGLGGLYGLFSSPGEDEEGNKRSRLWRALKGMGLGGVAGAGAGVAGLGGGIAGGVAGGIIGARHGVENIKASQEKQGMASVKLALDMFRGRRS